MGQDTYDETSLNTESTNNDCAGAKSNGIRVKVSSTTIAGTHDASTPDYWRFVVGVSGIATFTYTNCSPNLLEYATDNCPSANNIDAPATHTLIGSKYYSIAIPTSVSTGTYTITIDGASPVELTSFTATKPTNAVKLNWTTATEINNYGFEIEQQILNQVQNDNSSWEAIGFVDGHGNSYSPKEYSFVATNGATHFRLKQIDTDGGFEYSKVVTVASDVSFKLSQNHPNPFNPSTVINYEIENTNFVSLKIYNTLGQEVKTLENKEQNAGRYQVEFNTNGLPSGTYFYKIESGNFSEVKKMLLIK